MLSNPAVSTATGWPVGFWWSDLTHPYFRFAEIGYEVDIYSPVGGRCGTDAMIDPDDASRWKAEDVISRGFKHYPDFMRLVENTGQSRRHRRGALRRPGRGRRPGPMFTFEKAESLQAKFSEFYGTGKPTAALCHGVAILRSLPMPRRRSPIGPYGTCVRSPRTST